ncbi:MAG: DUF58 domain-containing protein [Candidatus Bipolaricaulia bacterium]
MSPWPAPDARGWRWIRWLRPRKAFRITRLGKIYIVICIVTIIAALNTGNNLLYLLAGMMLSFILASGILSELSLRRISVARGLPTELYAGRRYTHRLIVRNLKRRLPSFALKIRELEPVAQDRTVLFLKASPSGVVEERFPHRFERRGIVQLRGFEVATRYPFGLFEKYYQTRTPEDVLVFPRLVDVDPELDRIQDGGKDSNQHHKGHGYDLFGVREFSEGDNPRHIHWTSTAKQGRLMVKEFEQEEERRVLIQLQISNGLKSGEPRLEEAISRAASLAKRLLELGYEVGLATPEGLVSPGKSEERLYHILRHLALFDPERVPTSTSGPTERSLPEVDRIQVTV